MGKLKKIHLVTLMSLLMTFSVGILIAQNTSASQAEKEKPRTDFQRKKDGPRPRPLESDKRSEVKEVTGKVGSPKEQTGSVNR